MKTIRNSRDGLPTTQLPNGYTNSLW
jgi:hypothetical protein